jgi:hypothetical protein
MIIISDYRDHNTSFPYWALYPTMRFIRENDPSNYQWKELCQVWDFFRPGAFPVSLLSYLMQCIFSSQQRSAVQISTVKISTHIQWLNLSCSVEWQETEAA